MKSWAEYKIALISLLSLAFVAFLGKSYENLLRGIDSNIHAKVSLSATASGKKMPHLPIPSPNSGSSTADPERRSYSVDPHSYFNDHPFFYFWVNGWTMRALGPSG